MPAKNQKNRRTRVIPTRTSEVLDVRMTAELLTVLPDTVYDLFKCGELPGRGEGKKIMQHTKSTAWFTHFAKWAARATGRPATDKSCQSYKKSLQYPSEPNSSNDEICSQQSLHHRRFRFLLQLFLCRTHVIKPQIRSSATRFTRLCCSADLHWPRGGFLFCVSGN
jgi:hypothetical protein